MFLGFNSDFYLSETTLTISLFYLFHTLFQEVRVEQQVWIYFTGLMGEPLTWGPRTQSAWSLGWGQAWSCSCLETNCLPRVAFNLETDFVFTVYFLWFLDFKDILIKSVYLLWSIFSQIYQPTSYRLWGTLIEELFFFLLVDAMKLFQSLHPIHAFLHVTSSVFALFRTCSVCIRLEEGAMGRKTRRMEMGLCHPSAGG